MIRFDKKQMEERLRLMMEFVKSAEENSKNVDAKTDEHSKTS